MKIVSILGFRPLFIMLNSNSYAKSARARTPRSSRKGRQRPLTRKSSLLHHTRSPTRRQSFDPCILPQDAMRRFVLQWIRLFDMAVPTCCEILWRPRMRSSNSKREQRGTVQTWEVIDGRISYQDRWIRLRTDRCVRAASSSEERSGWLQVRAWVPAQRSLHIVR